MGLKNLFNRITRRQVPNNNYPNFVNISDQVYPEMLENNKGQMAAGALYGPERLDEFERQRLHYLKNFREWERQAIDDYRYQNWNGENFIQNASNPREFVYVDSDGKPMINHPGPEYEWDDMDTEGVFKYSSYYDAPYSALYGDPKYVQRFDLKRPKLPAVIPAAGAAVAGAALPALFSNLKGNALPALGNAAIKLLK